MDKQTLSNYGWVIVVVLVLAVMLGLATPFGKYVGVGIGNIAKAYKEASNADAIDKNVDTMRDEWNEFLGNNSTIDMSKVDPVLKNNSWKTIQAVAKANKVAEAGWQVGDTKSVEINGTEYDATIIGINHDGENSITFMIVGSGGIGYQYMNPYDEELGYGTNEGGWKDSAMREWLATDIYNSMTDVKDYIKPVTKLTNNIGYNGNTVSETSDTVFLLSPKECGIEWQMADNNYWAWPDYVGIDALNAEGTTYEWFANGGYIDDYFWLRSPGSDNDNIFFSYFFGDLNNYTAYSEHTVCPAFVIG